LSDSAIGNEPSGPSGPL